MKLSVLQSDFLNNLSLATRFISSKTQLPILNNILLEAENGKLKLKTTNLETGITINVGANIEKEGKTSVPAKILLELISNLKSGKIQLEEKKDQLTISSESFSANLTTIPPNDFPFIPEKIKEKNLSLNKNIFSVLANQISFACSNNDARPVLTGIQISFDKNPYAVSTDGFRLSYKELGLSLNISVNKEKPLKVLIPGRVINELDKAINVNKVGSQNDEIVDIGLEEKESQVLFGYESFILTTRLIEGEFPDFRKIIPQKWESRVTLDREELSLAVKTASVFAKDTSSIIKLVIGDGKVVLSSENNQFGKEKLEIEGKTEGENLTIAFNYKFILDFLNSVDGRIVSIESQGKKSPGVFQDLNDKTYKHIIMPIRIED